MLLIVKRVIFPATHISENINVQVVHRLVAQSTCSCSESDFLHAIVFKTNSFCGSDGITLYQFEYF